MGAYKNVSPGQTNKSIFGFLLEGNARGVSVYSARVCAHAARRPIFDKFIGFLNEFNRSWAKHTAAIVIVLSKSTFTPPGAAAQVPEPTHSFDTDAA
ncbi:nitroreductase family protein [Paraburkholderia sp. RL17-337-BIB-A]|uniref:hypothetical protein n=1 Tax=Paraburkholderia sp. RL17-337-BIB-A TaxID=3031636 RepID=UPI0038BC4F0D